MHAGNAHVIDGVMIRHGLLKCRANGRLNSGSRPFCADRSVAPVLRFS